MKSMWDNLKCSCLSTTASESPFSDPGQRGAHFELSLLLVGTAATGTPFSL